VKSGFVNGELDYHCLAARMAANTYHRISRVNLSSLVCSGANTAKAESNGKLQTQFLSSSL